MKDSLCEARGSSRSTELMSVTMPLPRFDRAAFSTALPDEKWFVTAFSSTAEHSLFRWLLKDAKRALHRPLRSLGLCREPSPAFRDAGPHPVSARVKGRCL